MDDWTNIETPEYWAEFETCLKLGYSQYGRKMIEIIPLHDEIHPPDEIHPTDHLTRWRFSNNPPQNLNHP